eukprot:6370836-Amphidinium_carterae.1
MAEDLDQDLPDFDGDAEVEACGDQLGSLVLQTPAAEGQLEQDAAQIEEIPSGEEGIPTVWVDRPCKAEEDTKHVEKKEEPADGQRSDVPETKEEDKVSVQPKREPPPIPEPAAATSSAQLPTAATSLEQVGAEADTEMAPVASLPVMPLEQVNAAADTAMTPVAEHLVASGPAPRVESTAEIDARRRHESNGRVHLGMSLEGVIRNTECMKEVLTVAAEQVGRVNAETSLAKSNLREHLRTGADQAWIAVWHVLFVAKGVQTQSVKALVEVHKPGSRWSHWHLNEAFFNALHTMQSALSSLTETWKVVSTLVSKTKAKQVWESMLLASNLPSRAELNSKTADEQGKATASKAAGSSPSDGPAPTPAKSMPTRPLRPPPPPKPTGDTSESDTDDAVPLEQSVAHLKPVTKRRTAFSPETQYASWTRFGLLQKLEYGAKRRRLAEHPPWSRESVLECPEIADTDDNKAPWRRGRSTSHDQAYGIPPPPTPSSVKAAPPPSQIAPTSLNSAPVRDVPRAGVPPPPPASVSRAKLALPTPPGCFRTSTGDFKRVPAAPKKNGATHDLHTCHCWCTKVTRSTHCR